MTLFNKHTQYAILLINSLSATEVVNLHQVAETTGLSQAFLSQVAQKLKVAGLITSFTGPKGGYRLSNHNVTLFQVAELFQRTGETLVPEVEAGMQEFLKNVPIITQPVTEPFYHEPVTNVLQ